MKKMIVCGKENLNGKQLMIAPLDEKNVTTDWIEDFLFEGNCAKANADVRYAGFLSLNGEVLGEMLCDVFCSDVAVSYIFPCSKCLEEDEVEYFCNAVREYFAENEFTIEVDVPESDSEEFYPYGNVINIKFYFRLEEE